jgi:hypothetical protein
MLAIRIVDQLADQADVLITSPSGGDVLQYDSESGKWMNAPPSAGDHITDGDNTLTIDETGLHPSNPTAGTFLDSTAQASVSLDGRQLEALFGESSDVSGVTVQWQNRTLETITDPDGNPTSVIVLNWSGQNDSNPGVYWFDAANGWRLTGDGSGLTAVNVSSINGGSRVLSIDAYGLHLGDACVFVDAANYEVMDVSYRRLFACSVAETLVAILDWGGANDASCAYWFDAAYGYRLTGDGSGLTGLSETDPVVGAVDGIVKSNGAGGISSVSRSDLISLLSIPTSDPQNYGQVWDNGGTLMISMPA